MMNQSQLNISGKQKHLGSFDPGNATTAARLAANRRNGCHDLYGIYGIGT